MTVDAPLPQGVPFALTDGANDLADEKVVELLVRGFTEHCLDLFQKVAADRCDLDDAVATIGHQAETLNALFLGTSPIREVVIHPWNSPQQLGVYLRDALGLDFPPNECVRAAFIHVATLLMHTIQGKPSDWEQEAEDLRLDLRDLLLGRQPLAGDGEDDDGTLPGLA